MKQRVGRVSEDPREDVVVGVGVVQFQLYATVGTIAGDFSAR